MFVSGIVEAWVGDRKDRLYRYCTLHQRIAEQDDVMCSASACAHCCVFALSPMGDRPVYVAGLTFKDGQPAEANIVEALEDGSLVRLEVPE